MADQNFRKLALIGVLGFGFGFSVSSAQPQAGLIAANQSPAPRAIQCSATLELMARAAPNWSSQTIVQEAHYYWRTEAEQVAQAAGRDASTEIAQEMGLLAEQAVSNTDELASQATLCLSDVPSAGLSQR